MSDRNPYTPDRESVQMHYEDGTIRMNPTHTIREATAEFDRFIAQVKRDAARAALDGLADGYACEPDIGEPEFECEAFVIRAARHYRDTRYPEDVTP